MSEWRHPRSPWRLLEKLIAVLRSRRVVVLAGAGCSTESGIPDYGGLDAKRRRNLVQYRAFVEDPSIRLRYWARSAVGWTTVASASPNKAHQALVTLERCGYLSGVITQNVDGLHHAAGNRRVVELHGSLHRVRCLDCGGLEARASLQGRLLALNPGIADGAGAFAPDGDAEVRQELIRSFRVPACSICGGVLKPDVVFFGENVPKRTVQAAWQLYDDAEILLVVGSSLAVFSGFRFVERAVSEQRPVAIINMGPTRADEYAAVKIDAPLGQVLPGIVNALADRRNTSTSAA